ncbi:MAG: hypothetical protein JSR55_06680 [Proteobacteria bacterium]|nr:hypothetical protein [Pseudomonadota bacterium]
MGQIHQLGVVSEKALRRVIKKEAGLAKIKSAIDRGSILPMKAEAFLLAVGLRLQKRAGSSCGKGDTATADHACTAPAAVPLTSLQSFSSGAGSSNPAHPAARNDEVIVQALLRDSDKGEWLRICACRRCARRLATQTNCHASENRRRVFRRDNAKYRSDLSAILRPVHHIGRRNPDGMERYGQL